MVELAFGRSVLKYISDRRLAFVGVTVALPTIGFVSYKTYDSVLQSNCPQEEADYTIASSALEPRVIQVRREFEKEGATPTQIRLVGSGVKIRRVNSAVETSCRFLLDQIPVPGVNFLEILTPEKYSDLPSGHFWRGFLATGEHEAEIGSIRNERASKILGDKRLSPQHRDLGYFMVSFKYSTSKPLSLEDKEYTLYLYAVNAQNGYKPEPGSHRIYHVTEEPQAKIASATPTPFVEPTITPWRTTPTAAPEIIPPAATPTATHTGF